MTTPSPAPRPELEEGVTELERMNDHLDLISEVLGEPESIAEAAMHAAWWTAGATLLLVGGAILTFVAAWRTLRQMKRDSHAQTRPYVHARLEPSVAGASWDLVIANTGKSTARELKLDLKKWPNVEGDMLVDHVREMFKEYLTLPPETHIRVMWNLNPGRKRNGHGAEGFVDPTSIQLAYTDDRNAKKKKFKEYTDEYLLDADVLGMTPLGWSGRTVSSEDGVTAKKLAEIVQSINQLRL
ncbi:hypothetical protein [Citricoccus sp. K5]|uniref:hypothetical protein n=1 Tax=Citricoccus sp. K5 TaxID=2653135 RepID=UPI0012F01D59|nr:hypothetical protein [Citricoccus sp. K5]VXA92829.1 conserved hypothetical protein [Citricoccus sp. K5]VXA95323.1 conserved hypothetical protein [Citricoccus sp. K5]